MDYSHYGHMLLLLDGAGKSIFQGARTVLSMEEEEGTCNKRRRLPFFTSPEELLEEEEEFYDEQLPPDHSKKRRLTPEQVHMLEKSFETENKLEPDRKSQLAKKLGLQPRQVAVWFQNRRARWRTKQLERDFECLNSAYDSLLADHDNLLKANDRLRSQVITLTEKLQTKEFPASVPTGNSAHLTSLQVQPKVEDHLSTGSGGSAVVDGEGPQQIVDSYEFPENFQEMAGTYYGGRVTSESSEGEDGSDERCNYDMFSESQHADNWWVWST